MNLKQRPRRLRKSHLVRSLVQEHSIRASDLIWPVFIKEGLQVQEPIPSLPGCFRFSVDSLIRELDSIPNLHAIALFPSIEEKFKTKDAKEALNKCGLIPKAIQEIKIKFPDLVIITDIALDPYSSDGHDGIVEGGKILNDATVEVLCNQALIHAQAGSDFVAPSDMMDGRIGAIRTTLEENNFTDVGIISYTAKYASSFYGPFRDALASTPRFGDKKTYQMNPMNSREALREARLDILEGADILMVKPTLCYLDIVRSLRQMSDLPIAAYNVSGEYAMVKFASQNRCLDEQRAVFEILGSIKRAGADIVFSYHTPDVLRWLNA